MVKIALYLINLTSTFLWHTHENNYLNHQGLCIFGPKGAIQIRYYYYYFVFLLLWTPAQRKRASMLYFANVFFYLFIFLWPPYSPALVNGGSRKFYTWWTLSGVREVTTWIFSWSSLNYRVGQKVTKFGIFSDPARKLSALTPERGRIL